MSESLRIVAPGPEREHYLDLLLLADESEQQVRSYLNTGDLYIFAPERGEATGMILAIPEPGAERAVELKAVAVAPERQGRGAGSRMLRAVLDDLRARGVRRVIVGTANAGIGQLAYYQKAGFRLVRIDRDFFSPEKGYPAGMEENGIPLLDMVWMEQEF